MPIIRPVQYIKAVEAPANSESSSMLLGGLGADVPINQALSKERELFTSKLNRLRERLNRGSHGGNLEPGVSQFRAEQDAAVSLRSVEH
jgi:hypothetical protein